MQAPTYAHIQRLLRELKAEIARSDLTMVDLDRRLRRGRNYHSGLLRGRVDLNAEHIYDILEVLGVEPGEFFARLHPPPADARKVEDDGDTGPLSLQMVSFIRQAGEIAQKIEERELRKLKVRRRG
jgi:hypothetical protein